MNYAEELERIEAIDDPEEQGYQSAALVCAMTGATPQLLLSTTVDSPFTEGDNFKREAGLKRWCLEQMEKQNEPQENASGEGR